MREVSYSNLKRCSFLLSNYELRKTDLVNVLRPLVVGCEPEDLLEVSESFVHVVLVVKAEAADENRVHVGAVL